MENIKDFWGNMFTSPIISNHLETWIIEHNYEAEDALRYASVTWILDYACKRINESLLIILQKTINYHPKTDSNESEKKKF